MSLRDRFRRKKDCSHVGELKEVQPDSPDACLQCVEMGDTWVNLRLCLTCGQVGCCDASKNKHATAHHKETGHPLIQSYQPAETWRYCYVDERMVTDAKAPVRS